MPAITSITALIDTFRHPDAGTDGNVYLGICGREFRCDTSADDFESNVARLYHFGEAPTPAHAVQNAAANDPRNPRLHTVELDLYPVYLRFDQGSSDHWAMEMVKVWINDVNGAGPHHYERQFFPKAALWMGRNSGAFCYLHKVKEIPD